MVRGVWTARVDMTVHGHGQTFNVARAAGPCVRVLTHYTLELRYASPNQVLTHAARAAATQLNFSHSVAARGAREGPWSGQRYAAGARVDLPCAHGPSRAASLMLRTSGQQVG